MKSTPMPGMTSLKDAIERISKLERVLADVINVLGDTRQSEEGSLNWSEFKPETQNFANDALFTKEELTKGPKR